LFNAVILAGSSAKGDLEEQEQVDNKAFIYINSLTMIETILVALEKVEYIDNIAVVGPPDGMNEIKDKGYFFEIVEQQETYLDNIAAGLEQLDLDKPCVVVSADIPLITQEAIEDFLGRCAPYDQDFYYPIISKEDCEKKFPEVKRTYVRLREGTFTGGNIMMIKPSWILNKIEDIQMYLSYRKRPWKIIRTFPYLLIVKFLIRRLTIKDLEQYVSQLMNINAQAVSSSYVEIAVDVDKVEDLALVKKYFT